MVGNPVGGGIGRTVVASGWGLGKYPASCYNVHLQEKGGPQHIREFWQFLKELGSGGKEIVLKKTGEKGVLRSFVPFPFLMPPNQTLPNNTRCSEKSSRNSEA